MHLVDVAVLRGRFQAGGARLHRPLASRVLAATAAVAVLLAVALIPTPAQAAPGWHPSNLASVGDAEQVVVVTARSWSSTTGTLRAYERDDTDGGDGWREVVGATSADLGWSGLTPAAKRRQGSGKTPVGTFAITSALGRQADPGTALDYHRFDRDDRWTFDPKSPSTYNVLQTNGGAVSRLRGEHLWRFGPQYDYIAVMDFNLPDGTVTTDARGIRRVAATVAAGTAAGASGDGATGSTAASSARGSAARANTRMGGAIFLHVTKNEPTAGCIAIPRDQMRAILRWLDPAKHPVIITRVES